MVTGKRRRSRIQSVVGATYGTGGIQTLTPPKLTDINADYGNRTL
jgi:hypothetical protein